MSENLFEDKDEATEAAGEEIKKDFKGLLGSVRKFTFDNLLYFYRLNRFERKLISSCYWCDVNFSINGPNFRNGHVISY